MAAGILTRLASTFGAETVAAYGVATRIEALSFIGVQALYSGLTPFIGQNFGARNCDRLRQAMQFCIKAAVVLGLAVAAILALVARPLAGLFNEDPTVIAVASRYLTIIPFSYTMMGTMILVNGFFNAVNQPMKPALLIVVRLFVLAVPLAYFGARLSETTGMFVGIAVANLVVGVLAFVMVNRFIGVVEREQLREAGLSTA